MNEHVLVVDDDQPTLNLLQRLLERDGYVVDMAHGGLEALAHALERQPELVLLDLRLPGLDGLEVCRRLREGGDEAILVLTASDHTASCVAALNAGADDYVTKPFEGEELLARMRALLRRRGCRHKDDLRFADLMLDLQAREVRRGSRAIDLSPKEFELLAAFMRTPRTVLTFDELLSRAWGDTYYNRNLVTVYVGYLRDKLEAAGEPRLIHTVPRVGYILKERQDQ
ncbi:MAG TPA: response regulator transcription factor [Chloroflexota bacterium]|jgi:two-component system response regulator MprA|nr:response regulator transcription factor [Chloroflexota bacterium]